MTGPIHVVFAVVDRAPENNHIFDFRRRYIVKCLSILVWAFLRSISTHYATAKRVNVEKSNHATHLTR